MANNFITNSNTKILKKRLLELLPETKELKFLVGFFYFSGLRELYEGLKNNPDIVFKILVGLHVDKTSNGLIENDKEDKNLSDEERIHLFFNSVKHSINTELFDNKDFYEQVKFFIHLIKNDRLIIRKTCEPNHAKLYIFKLKESQVGKNALFITGSSNLTSSGLSHQQEFNVEISDYGFDEAEEYFDDLWERAIPITEDNITKQKLINLIEKETLIREITPYEAYVLVLKTYLDSFKGKTIGQRIKDLLNEKGYKIYQYQLDAVSQALSIIEQNNGVIIADVVGLGKSVIACAIAFELKKRGIVIAPPGLIGDEGKQSGWRKYLEDFGLASLGWEAHSLGDLEKVSEFIKSARDIEVIIVDEAHRFRNQDTQDYEMLKNICRGKTVILLTATPFNNKPADIFSLLKLFIVPKKSKITLSDDLEAKFSFFKVIFDLLAYIKRYSNSSDLKKRKKAISYYKAIFGNENLNLKLVQERAHYLAKEIRNVIEPVLIRRNRLDLQENPNYKNEIKELARVNDPQEWFFELSPEQSSFYDKVINEYFALPEDGGRFSGAIYRPFIYERGLSHDLSSADFTKEENFQYQQQFNLYDFMRRLLVKRFESSFGAFKQSIINFRDITETVIEFIQKTGRYILDRDLLQKIYQEDLETIEWHLKQYSEKIRRNEYPKNHKIYEINKFKDKTRFLNDINSDYLLFNRILEELNELNLVNHDPKVSCLINNLSKVLQDKSSQEKPYRKVVIFSEYVDTVKYLAPILLDKFNKRVLVVPGDLPSGKIRDIYENFDASYPKQKNEYDILLTTDKISEGFNLNRAGMVINYDIPWNPVRVIQRIGRINRISKKVFDDLYIINFFPTEMGANLVKSREIASNKMFLIHNALGEDAKIFDIDEEPSPSGLYKRIQQNPDYLEKESFYTIVIKEFEKIKAEDPELIRNLDYFPPRVKVAKRSKGDGLFVFIKKGKLFVHYRKYEDNFSPTISNLEYIYDKIIASKQDTPLPLSDKFWDEYENLKKLSEIINKKHVEHSVQQKAINVLKTILTKLDTPELIPFKDFLRMVLEDIVDYGTLADYTLRRISNLNLNDIPSLVEELKILMRSLGTNYLYKEKDKLNELTKEIIIAIENRT